eukprot:1178756-Prorocentrum_minimum.AAC.1
MLLASLPGGCPLPSHDWFLLWADTPSPRAISSSFGLKAPSTTPPLTQLRRCFAGGGGVPTRSELEAAPLQPSRPGQHHLGVRHAAGVPGTRPAARDGRGGRAAGPFDWSVVRIYPHGLRSIGPS